MTTEAMTVTDADVERAVCESEVAGAGHRDGDIPCEWHTAAGNERVARLIHALRSPRMGNEPEPDVEPPREEFNERACPACGAVLSPSDTHFSLFAGPAGSYVCPVPPSKGA